ncbi:MAG: hypothetical protein KKA62_04755 [Nanoarchaeota archaeon]|nr:hypothetical protein [Nanoarchaeota archaeon]MBU1644249.1 hypothetical protein [Nanoarchaeota archaeon]MBU1977231.1 hypothetical protein [Nanoarchaeota archaeon]
MNRVNLIQESYQRLFPEKEFSYLTDMEYNRRLSNFNANISYSYNRIKINLNLQWKDIDDEIKIGLIQHLLLKVFKKKNKKNTVNIELYNNFIKNIPTLTPKTKDDPVLNSSFTRVNNVFFSDSLEKPNLIWGSRAYRKLASYNFHEDAVTVSSIFCDAEEEVLDYLMYHELLHKYHKFKHKNGRSSFHTRAFREDESKYPQQNEIEKKIEDIIRSKKGNKRKEQKQKNKKENFWRFMLG